MELSRKQKDIIRAYKEESKKLAELFRTNKEKIDELFRTNKEESKKLAELFRTNKEEFTNIIIKKITINNENCLFIYLDNLAKNVYNYDMKNGTSGYLYCLYNEIFAHYGDNVYKLGKTINIKRRLGGYSTPYIEPCKMILKSELFVNYSMAEKVLFYKLQKYRVKKKREFFKCPLDEIKKALNNVKEYFEQQENVLYINSIFDKIEYEVTKEVNNGLATKELNDGVTRFEIVCHYPKITAFEINYLKRNGCYPRGIK